MNNMSRLHFLSKFRAVQKNVEKLEQTCLSLLAHPDATAEQIDQARLCLMDVRGKLRVLVEKAYTKGLKVGHRSEHHVRV